MDVIWRAKDVVPGQQVGKVRTHERFILGFSQGDTVQDKQFLIVSLSDGMVIARSPEKETIANWLTTYKYQPVELLDRQRRAPDE